MDVADESADDPPRRVQMSTAGRWRPPLDGGAVYQIYPRSFLDTDGDGIGDLEGIRRRLDHLRWLGVDALWLSPIYRSPMADFGYDVSDHCDVDPLFGTLDDAGALVEAAHERDLRVLLDWVPNHTSDQHAWFQDSRSSRDDPKRDWYVWRDPRPDGDLPNNWMAHFPLGARAWTLDPATGQYYLHLFLPEQPDLNWANPDVRAAQHDVLRFWLDRGVDGFRADVVHLIGKDPALADDPPELEGVPRAVFHDLEMTHDYLREVRGVLDAYDDRLMVGEINLLDAAQVARYVGRQELHLAFHFGLMWAPWEARSWRDVIGYVHGCFDREDAWPAWVLGNHDTPRQVTRYGGSQGRARVAATVLLGLRGTPFLYAGEELGLADAEVPDTRVVDPGGRDGCRAPIPWDGSATHGWPDAEPWLPWPPEADRRNVAALRNDPGSILHLYRRLLAERRHSPALRVGSMEVVDAGEPVVALRREHDADRRLVLANFGDDEVAVESAADWRVRLASDGHGEGETFTGRLRALQAVVLAPG